MTTIIKVTAAEVAALMAAGKLSADAARLDTAHPMLEVHNATGQAYPRTVRAYEATRRMAAGLGSRTVAKLERDYTVYQLV